jgi:GNAT superfamily N-acetyltransferase
VAREVRPVTPERWDDLVDLFERRGPRGGSPMTAGCWCMWWRQRAGKAALNKRNMEAIVREGREPGLLAYEAGIPVGWVSVGPREEFGQLLRSRSYGPKEDEPGVFSIVCVTVDPRARRGGAATALLEAAVDYAVGRGAAAIEAYPHVSDPRDYMGSRAVFRRLGFEPVRDAGKRTIVRYRVPSR